MGNNDYIPDQYKGALEKLNYEIYRVKRNIYIKSDNIKRKKYLI